MTQLQDKPTAKAGRAPLEEGFPTRELAPVAERESWRKEVFRPVYHMHKWWAKRLGSVFRAVLIAGLSEPGHDVWAEFYRRHDFRGKVVLDPFMGGGTTLGEALKLGASVVGCDINPVSTFLVRKALQAVDVAALGAALERLRLRYLPRVERFYRSTWPATGEAADVMYTFWAMTVHCPDCQGRTRLFSRWVFSQDAYPSKKPQAKCLCPACGAISSVRFDAREHGCPACYHRFDPQAGPAERSAFTCEGCGKRHPIQKTIRATGRPPEYEMYALMLLLPNGEKVYKAADAADRALYAEAAAALEASAAPYPLEEIAPGINTDQLLGYNITRWHHLFNARQLLALSTLLEEIGREEDRVLREYLVLLFSGSLEFNTMLCSFKGEGTGAVRHMFSHHILKPERTPLENHPWGTPKSSGAFANLFERRLLAGKAYCADPFELRIAPDGSKAEQVSSINRPIAARLTADFAELAASQADAMVLNGSSASLPLPDATVDLVATDPPYFDMVNYSELADFFHVWLRLALPDDLIFRPATTRHEEEVQSNNAAVFEANLAAVFQECARVLKPEGLLAFTFHHREVEAWAAVAGAVRSAGLKVVAAHPVKAEMSVSVPKSQAKEPIDLDAVLVCRQAAQLDRRPGRAHGDPVGSALERARDSVADLNHQGLLLSLGDVRVVALSQLTVAAEDGPSFDSAAEAVVEGARALHMGQSVKREVNAPAQQPLF